MTNVAQYSTPKHRTSRISVTALVITILLAAVIYALVAFDTASEIRSRNALNQNGSAARISARLLDEQWQDVLVVIHELVQHSSVETDLRRQNRPGLNRELKYAVDLVPALLLAAVYDKDGRLVATYPDSPLVPQQAAGAAWFEGVKKQHALYLGDSMRVRLPGQLLTDVISVAVPVGDKLAPSGYMLALNRVGDVDLWLRDLGMQGSDLYVVNSSGTVVDASTGADRGTRFSKRTSFQLALQRGFGTLVSHRFYTDDDADVGYAYAFKPGWAVIVARPVNLAMAPTRTLAARLSLLGIIVFALLASGTSLIVRLFRTQNRMALTLTRQNAQLREADRIKSDFLANVSHDLRTPLATMQISISSLLEPDLVWKPDEVKENLREAGESLDQISSRVTNLLEMARLEAHIWPLNKHVCDLTDLVGAVLERMKILTAGRDLALTFPDRPLLLECDPNQIETVIVNLLENAIKYSPPGSKIEMTGEELDGWIRFIISDFGTGIPTEDLDYVFDKFFRSRRHTLVGGTGLGLAICSSIIGAHGGVVGVNNVPKQPKLEVELTDMQRNGPYDVAGARFWFELPALLEEAI